MNLAATMQTLTERGLVEGVGRAEVVGRPPTYGTTALFLEYFGLSSLEGLPAADELRRMVVEKPPGLATNPPEQLALENATPKPDEGGKAEAGSQKPEEPEKSR